VVHLPVLEVVKEERAFLKEEDIVFRARGRRVAFRIAAFSLSRRPIEPTSELRVISTEDPISCLMISATWFCYQRKDDVKR
jgi:hypothetical protein